jgi:ubiquinone/menaquinone biosynthesis C-methylase UbiE
MSIESVLSTPEIAGIYDAAYRFQCYEMDIMGTRVDKAYNHFTKEQLAVYCEDAVEGPFLEIGTGDGDFGPYMEKYHPEREWVGFDLSLCGLCVARERFPKVKTVEGDMSNLPFPEENFGAVILADTLEHALDIPYTLKEINRIMKPGGTLAICVPDPSFFYNWTYNILKKHRLDLFYNAAKAAIIRKHLLGRAKFQPIDQELYLEEWGQMINGAEFEIIDQYKWPADNGIKPLAGLIKAKKRV